MTIMTDFLSRFKNPISGIRRHTVVEGEAAPRVWFLLERLDDGSFIVSAADESGHKLPAPPDYHNFTGAVSTVLRTLERIAADSFASVGWGDVPEAAVRLADHPELAGMLAVAGHVIDSKGSPVNFSDMPGRLAYCLNRDENRPDTLVPRLELEVGGEKTQGTPSMLTDSYVMMGTTVYAVPSVGDNYSLLPPFLESFDTHDAELALSMFMSCFTGIEVAVEGLKTVVSTIPECFQPTIVFERIDSEKALYLRVAATNPRLSEGSLRLGLTMIARIDDERKVLEAHPLAPLDLEPFIDDIRTVVKKSLPSRKDWGGIYDDGEGLFILPSEVAPSFLFKGLPGLLGRYRILGADKLREYNVRTVKPKLNVSLSSGIDFLEGSADVTVGEERMSLADFIKRYSSNSYVTLSDGTQAIIDSDYMRRLKRIYSHNAAKGKKGEFKISFFDLPEVEAMLDEQLTGEAVGRSRALYEGFARLPGQKLEVDGLNATLRPYQTEGVKWINYLYENNLGGCLADDMGLGKTIQTIAMLLKIYPQADKPTLIVMPRSLLFNWERELDRFAPSLTHTTYYGTDRSLEEALKSQVILTTYALVRNDIEALSKIEFEYVVLDESQNIKNTGAQVSRAVWLLRGTHRLAISGTPIENNLTELYSLFRFLNPTMFGPLDDFNELYTVPIQHHGDELASADLRRKVFPFILRRVKQDVLPDLPDLVEQTLDVEMEPAHAAFYERRRAEYYERVHSSIASEGLARSQFVMLQALTELRRIVSVPESLSDGHVRSSKMPLLVEQLADLAANGHKTVVFFNFIAGIELAGEELERLGIGYATMTGATTARKQVIDRFVSDPECRVLLMTLKTGGVGLNLTVADTVVIFEPWWNRAAELQAINRLHRIGQKAKVMSYSMITHGTIEEKIRELQEKKSLLVDEIISTDAGAFKHLTEEDVDFILGK